MSKTPIRWKAWINTEPICATYCATRKTLQDYVDAGDDSIPIPAPIVKDILAAEDDNRRTRELVDNRETNTPNPRH